LVYRQKGLSVFIEYVSAVRLDGEKNGIIRAVIIWLFSFIKFKPFSDGLGLFLLARGKSEIRCLLSGGCCIVKFPGRCVGGCQGVKHPKVFVICKLTGVLRKPNSLTRGPSRYVAKIQHRDRLPTPYGKQDREFQLMKSPEKMGVSEAVLYHCELRNERPQVLESTSYQP
jgi:hypothetical protein